MSYFSNVRGAFISITDAGFVVRQVNSLVDRLLKKEFDFHRVNRSKHPLMDEYGVDAVSLQHPQIHEWREKFKGIRPHHGPTNLIVTGAVDDLWVNPDGEIAVVDYTSATCAAAE